MEDKIFEMVIESMKQKLIFSDMVEMRKIIKGAVHMMEAHYEDKMPSDDKIRKMLDGMDRHRTDNDGWWESPEGARFGEYKLNELLSYIKQSLINDKDDTQRNT